MCACVYVGNICVYYIPAKYSIVYYNITYLSTMIFIAILYHTKQIYYSYKSKLYSLRNAMMIFCSLVKHTQKYIKNIFFSVIL